jgi:protein involved in polysaccharide export with SLBB domain
MIGAVSLRGVLRSELEAHLTQVIGQYIKEPVVHARSLIRLSVVGGVARPGFYFVPADAMLADALIAAGGPAPDAKVADLRVERAGKAVWEGAALQAAITQGRTLDQMQLRAGDQFVMPQRGHGTTYETVRTIGILLGIPVTVYTLTRIR